MVGSAIKKYAKEKSLTVKSGVAYGIIGGYLVTLTDGYNIKTAAFSGAVTDDCAKLLEEKFSDKKLKKEYRILNVDITRESVSVIFSDTIGTMKKIDAAMDVIPNILSACGVIGDGFCTTCGNTIDPLQESKILLINGVAHRVHAGCAQSVDMRAEIEKTDYELEEKHLGKGILGAFLGASLGGIAWGIIYYIGYLASIIGVLIAFLAKKGYELLGGKICKAKTIVILLASVFGVVLGQVGVYCVLIGIELVNGGFSLMAIPYVFIETLKSDAEFAGAFVSDMLGGLFFGILGAIGTALSAKNEHKNATIKTEVLE